jgi:hypothetical protein
MTAAASRGFEEREAQAIAHLMRLKTSGGAIGKGNDARAASAWRTERNRPLQLGSEVARWTTGETCRTLRLRRSVLGISVGLDMAATQAGDFRAKKWFGQIRPAGYSHRLSWPWCGWVVQHH